VPSAADVPLDTTVDGLLEFAAMRWGDLPFLVPGRGPTAGDVDPLVDDGPIETYGEVADRVGALASGLTRLGVAPGKRLGTLLATSRELLYLWFAVAKVGATLVPLNPALTDTEVSTAFNHADVDFVASSPPTSSRHGEPAVTVSVGRERSAAGSSVAFDDLLSDAGSVPRPGSTGSAPACVLYTSGTTARPKGCVLPHRAFVRPAVDFGEGLAVTPEDRFFVCLPLFHMAGQSFTLAAVAAGASVVLSRRFSGSRFWEQVGRSEATVFRYLGEMLPVLCRPDPTAVPPHRLRVAYGGGASPRVAEEFQRRFGVRVVEGYGLTETNTVLRNEVRISMPGSIGRGVGHAEVRVADADGCELADGDVGEIQVRRSPFMMTGYLHDAEATAEAFVGDWFRTGDLGRRDGDGYFYFVARSKDIIRRRGENIVAREVEEALGQAPGVLAVAVVPIRDDIGGEEGKAFVVPSNGADLRADDLADWCRRLLAPFKIPRFYEVCADLPRTATNKVDKALLQARGTLGGESQDLCARLGVDR